MKDFQKREAKQSLWDNDGQHIKKKYRNKGKGRGKDKKLIRDELLAEAEWDEIDLDNSEIEALYCYHYGSCEHCLKKKKNNE